MNNKLKIHQLKSIILVITLILALPQVLISQTSEYNFATGNVKGRNNVGGLLGRVDDKNGQIKNNYARGSVTGEINVGGLAGSNKGIVETSYATGKVTGNSGLGGLIGSGDTAVNGSYWDTQTSSQPISAGGNGRNTVSMVFPYQSDTYSGWNFNTIWKSDALPYQNGGYPLLNSSEVYQVSVQVYPPKAGIITGEGYYKASQQVQLNAKTMGDYVFKGWELSNKIIDTQMQHTLPVSGNINLVARFESKSTSVQTVQSTASLKIIVYPNPVKEIIWVDFSSLKQEITDISVVNIIGQTVKYSTPDISGSMRLSFNVSDLKPGVYIILVRHFSGIVSERFIKY